MANKVIQLSDGTDSLFPRSAIYETVNLSFSSGMATLAGKSGFVLGNIYAINRPSNENNDYTIDSIQRDTSGNYHLKNMYTALSSSLTVICIWIPVS